MNLQGHWAGAHYAARNAVLVSCICMFVCGCFQDNFSRDVQYVNDQEREDGNPVIPQGYPVPGASGALTLTLLTAGSAAFSWDQAIDDDTPQAGLQYQVYFSVSNNIRTVSEIDANLGVITRAADWTNALSTITVTGLSSGLGYYFNVVVRDVGGNRAAYAALPCTTSTVGFPVPGNAGAITISDITFDTMVLSWTQGADAETAQSDLEYRVYRSTSNNIRTVEEIDASSLPPVMDWTAALSTFTATGLVSGTVYYYNVLVRDASGNRSAYESASAATISSNGLFLFSTDAYDGNLMGVDVSAISLAVSLSVAPVSPRAHLDDLCRAVKNANFSDLQCANVSAFISTAGDDEIIDMPSNYAIPVDRLVRGPGPAYYKIAENWADLFDPDELLKDLSSAGVASNDWWSGSNADGTYAVDNSGMTPVGIDCNGWSDGTNAFIGRIGKKNKTDPQWIEYVDANCNTTQRVLCACW